MRPVVRSHPALSTLLDSVIADSRGCAKALFHISGFEQPILERCVAPDAGKAVSLRLDAH